MHPYPTTDIPRPSLSRLPFYYRAVLSALEMGEETISSAELGVAAGVPGTQVRKDLSYLGELGRAGVGYEVQKLATVLSDFLGLAVVKEALVVGAGNLGRALAAYPGFERYGLRIVALFDVDPAKIGAEVAGKRVYRLDQLMEVVRERTIRLGIIAVPADEAQAVADLLVKAGIEAIWNFAPHRVQVPSHILLEHEDLAARLATLSYYVTRQKLSAQSTERP